VAEYLKTGRPPGTSTDPEVQQRVSAILDDIAKRGEPAVREWSANLDHHDPASFRLDAADIDHAVDRVDPELRRHIDAAYEHVGAFARAQLATLTPLEVELAPGQVLGHRIVPVRAVGAYVPAGRYPLISSALMSILTAKTAGVDRVVAMTAPDREGQIRPPTVYAMHRAGADQIYALGGVQAMGALAHGALPGLDAVDMIVGAGNAYVAEAKRQLFGRVGIDLLAGPTEVLVIADETADPFVVAVDLLAQAEHGPTSPAILIALSRDLAEQVLGHIPAIVETWSTGDVAGTAWRDLGVAVVADSRDEAVELSDAYAPEHLQLQVAEPEWYEARLRNYGTVFVGEETTVAYGDKAVGTNHTLPTNGAARYTGGLWVGSYLKVLTYQRLTREASVRIGAHTSAISNAEGMVGHAASADIRLARYARGTAADDRSPDTPR
jgi:sulfopropanediol 3-dehydrogenase